MRKDESGSVEPVRRGVTFRVGADSPEARERAVSGMGRDGGPARPETTEGKGMRAWYKLA